MDKIKDSATINDCILFWQLNHTIYDLKPMLHGFPNNEKNTIDFFVKELKDSVLLNNSSNHHIDINMYNILEINPLVDISGRKYYNLEIRISLDRVLYSNNYISWIILTDNTETKFILSRETISINSF